MLTLAYAILIATLITTPSSVWYACILGIALGFILGAAFRFFCGAVHEINTPRTRIESMVCLGLLAGALIQMAIFKTDSAQSPVFHEISVYSFAVTALGLSAFAWIRLRRHAYEMWVETWFLPMFKIRDHGPGLREIPITGPVLVIANHACWWDPLFIASLLPRPITPIMTSNFYDIWHLKPFMKHVVHAIRVPEKPIKHETPEITEAIAALDRGECVVLFPEGYLRRKEEVPLRRFGRGAFEILKARPETPVVAAWVEGGWGSWCSWKDGPPTKNKRFDFRRRIDVGFGAPFTVPKEHLENHWAARVFLMNAVSAARVHLGLEPLPEFTVLKRDEEDAEKAPE